MIVLKGLLFSVFTLVLLMIISLLVVGIIKVMYKIISRKRTANTESK